MAMRHLGSQSTGRRLVSAGVLLAASPAILTPAKMAMAADKNPFPAFRRVNSPHMLSVPNWYPLIVLRRCAAIAQQSTPVDHAARARLLATEAWQRAGS